MTSPRRELIASINGQAVGTLRDEGNIWSFEYAPEWIDSPDGFNLAPNLIRNRGPIIDGASERPVQWFFDNLLPEEQAREVFAREAKIEGSDAFGLLAYYGKESAGALTLLAPGETADEGGYRTLSDDALHERISKLPQQSLAAQAPKRMSNAGAQHKLAICIRDGQLFEPVGNTPSTHLLKPDHVDRDLWPNSVANEYFVMKLAARLGLEVPAVQIRYVPDPVYIIERFDRHIEGTGTRRLHVIDACQLLGADRRFKYRQSNTANLVRCIDLCTNPARSRQSILAWTLFNVLTGNGDAHLKNLSFRVHAHGIELAPFYDLVSTESYRAAHGNVPRWPDRDLSLQLGSAKTFAAVTRQDFLTFADQLGVNRRAALRVLDEFTARIAGSAGELAAEFEALRISEALVRTGQLRVLNSIRFITIRGMLERLGTPGGANAGSRPMA